MSAGQSEKGAARLARVALDGVLLLDKPKGPGSTTVLARVKYLLRALKAGHTGTLDPLASGLLPLCFGEATKFSADLLDAPKSYRATMRLGATTTTGDAEGSIVSVAPVTCSVDDVDRVLHSFVGHSTQTPPMYSALKHQGRPLYDYARAGETVERSARAIEITRLERVEFDGAALTVDVHCSKGTYVRTLAEDIGGALHCGAHLTDLRRTAVADLSVNSAITLEQLEAMDWQARCVQLAPIDTLLRSLPRLDLAASESARFKCGQRIALGEVAACARVRVYETTGSEATLLGVAGIDVDGVLRPQRLVSSGQSTGELKPVVVA